MISFKELDLPQDSRNTATAKYKGKLNIIYIWGKAMANYP